MQTATTVKKEQKHKFKMPHILFLILGILLTLSVLTYIIPAGQFAAGEDGKLIGDQFEFLGEQTPVNLWEAMLQILPGLQSSSKIIGMMLIAAGFTGMVVSTKAFDNCIDYALFKLKDKGTAVLFPVMYILFAFIGCFAAGDSFITMLPIALTFAKKLRLDPICACIIILFAYHMGGMTGPEGAMFAQLTMGITPYSGIEARVAMWPIFAIAGLLLSFRYVKKISKDPGKSLLNRAEWYDDENYADMSVIKEATLDKRAVVTVVLFLAQPFISLFLVRNMDMGSGAQVAVWIILSIIVGLVYGYSLDDIGKAFSKGSSSMGFICVIIGMSAAISNVMTNGNIMHTIVYYACKPLQGMHSGFAAIGMSAVITLINVLIPSGSAKIAVLCPIISPMCTMLNLSPQIGVQALQFGDKLTNMISPVLGTTMAALAMAKVPYDKWVKFALPRILVMGVLSWAALFILTTIGWA